MPQTRQDVTSFLSIVLEPSTKTFGPGDVIIGHVICRQHLVHAQATISVTLCGRAKARLEFQSGKHKKVRRSRFQLINERQSRQVIHNGPIHVPPGGQQPLMAPFAIEIPTHVPHALSGSEQASFLPLDAASVAEQRLPSTMSAPSRHSRLEAFVEYFLEAKLHIKGGMERSATLPIVVRDYVDGPPITSNRTKSSGQLCSLSSPRLLPGMQDVELSTKDKMKMIFGTSSVPRYGFRLEVGAPTVVQLGHPDPISFTLRAVPDWKYASEGVVGVPQKIWMRDMHMTLTSSTMAMTAGTWGNYDLDSDDKIDIPIDRAFAASALQGKKIIIPCTDEWPPMDLGKDLGFRLGYSGSTGVWKRAPGLVDVVCPTTKTYNFQISHVLSWEIVLDVVGKEIRVRGRQAVEILPSVRPQGESYAVPPPEQDLPRSESWIQPPAEGDAPPSFTQVQKEDMMMNEGKNDADVEDDIQRNAGSSTA